MAQIVLFYKDFIQHGGAERLHYHLYDEMVQLGHKPILVFFSLDKNLLSSYKFESSQIHVINGSYISRIIKLTKLMWKSKYIIVSSGIIDVWLSSLFSNKKYIHLLHHPVFMSMTDNDKFSLIHKKHFDKEIYNSEYKVDFLSKKRKLNLLDKIKINIIAIIRYFAIRRAKVTFVLSEHAKHEKKKLYNINTIVNRAALKKVNKDIVKKKYNNDKLKILALGRLDKYKRFDVVVNSVINISKNLSIDVQLDIIGSGPEYIILEKIIKENKAENIINLLGYRTDEELKTYMEQAHLFISIDWADYRLTSFEALNYKIPVILSNESKEDINLIESGWCTCINPNQYELTKCIIKMMDEINDLDENFLNDYLEAYTWEDYTLKVLNSDKIHK